MLSVGSSCPGVTADIRCLVLEKSEESICWSLTSY